METLENLKNTYAQEQGYEDWADLYRRAGYYDETIFFKHENAVIILAEKAALEKVAENAKLVPLQGIGFIDFSRQMLDKHSITNPENLIL